MAASDSSKVKETLKQITEKIQLLYEKATEVVNRKEIEAQIQRLEKHKKQIEEELRKTSANTKKRWKESQPYLKAVVDNLGKAFKVLVGSEEVSTTTEKAKSSASTTKRITKRSVSKSGKKQNASSKSKASGKTTAKRIRTKKS